MDTIEALQYRYQLNKYINSCLKAGYTYESLWEWLDSSDPAFSTFVTTRIGFIWMKKEHGKEYAKWIMS